MKEKESGILIYEKIVEESRKLEKQIKFLQSQLKELPEGKLICALNGKGYKWYRSDGHNCIYLPKKERIVAEQLAYKKYLSLQLKNLLQEKKAIDFYLRHHNSTFYQKEQAFINSPKYKELLAPNFKPLEQDLQEWMQLPYEKCDIHPEHLVHDTYSGNVVRSKSEVLIDMVLYKNRIPFRYECMLELGDIIVYPDFTIRHPRTGQVFYWEHFGLMDNLNYSKNAISKLQLYTSNGIIPSIQLITTFETKEHPLTTEMIKKIVEHYFL